MAEPFRIGIAGLGTVGTGVVKALQTNAALITARAARPIQIVAVSARNRQKDRGVDLSGYTWVEDPQQLADIPGLNAVVELIGGSEGAAYALVIKSMEMGKHVVTANKAMLAHHGAELATIAESNDVSLAYEASVAGGIPIIKALREGYAANAVDSVFGILNGTCNYILTQMRETGRDFKEVLKEAQKKGYAEADPSFDVDGIDAGHKLALLAAIAFGTKPDFASVCTQGIRGVTSTDIAFAGELGYKIKLLAIARNFEGKIMQSVEPCLVRSDSTIGGIEDVFNAVYIRGNFVGQQILTGRGAGEGPTASAVIADIIDLAWGAHVPTFGLPVAALAKSQPADPGQTISGYYLRLNVYDRPGVLADVSATLRDNSISVEGLIQRGRAPDQPVPLVITTHETRQSDMMKAAALLEKLDCVVEKPCIMRIEADL